MEGAGQEIGILKGQEIVWLEKFIIYIPIWEPKRAWLSLQKREQMKPAMCW
jgi:hypothetical protein